MKSIRAAIDRFPAQQTVFRYLRFYWGKLTFCKRPQETGKIGGVVYKKPISIEQMKKLFGIGELATGERKHSAHSSFLFFFLFFFGQGGASVSTPANANNSGMVKNPVKDLSILS